MSPNDTWHEDDRFWADAAPIIFRADMLAKTDAEVDGVVKMLGLARGAHVLDLPCGQGRHSVELLRRGYRVTGVDRSDEYIRDARRAARTFNGQARWMRSDMRRFVEPDAFDGAINLYTSFGYFERIEDDELVARNMLRSLKPGGRLVMELVGKEVLARTFRPEFVREPPNGNGSLLIEQQRILKDWTWTERRWIMISGGRRRELTFSHRLYGAADLRALLERVGFRVDEVYGGLDGRPYDHEARRLVVVAAKAASRERLRARTGPPPRRAAAIPGRHEPAERRRARSPERGAAALTPRRAATTMTGSPR